MINHEKVLKIADKIIEQYVDISSKEQANHIEGFIGFILAYKQIILSIKKLNVLSNEELEKVNNTIDNYFQKYVEEKK